MNKFLILTNGRSGSNFVVDLLNQHPEVVNYGEVLGDWSKKRFIKKVLGIKSESSWLDFIYNNGSFFYLDLIFRVLKERDLRRFKLRRSVRCVGIKDFAIHFDRYRLERWLVENRDIKIINLYRENQLDRLISLVAMKATGTVLAKDLPKKPKKVHLDCSDLLAKLDCYTKELEFQLKLAESLQSERIISIKYEALNSLPNTSNLAKKIFDFLEIENIQVEERQKKILNGNLQSKVENYQELYETLSDSKYEKFLY